MSQGLQIFDASGNEVISFGTRVGRFLGYVDTTVAYNGYATLGTSGSITVSAFSSATGWFIRYPMLTQWNTDYFGIPTVNISGTTLSWDYSTPNGNGYAFATRIYYGVY